VTPLVAVAVAIPHVILFRTIWWLGLPLWCGMVASPGYLWSWWWLRHGHPQSRAATLAWAEVSLVVAVAASGAGTILMILQPLLLVFPVLSTFCATNLHRMIRRARHGLDPRAVDEDFRLFRRKPSTDGEGRLL
jgi:hypothetical protein